MGLPVQKSFVGDENVLHLDYGDTVYISGNTVQYCEVGALYHTQVILQESRLQIMLQHGSR